MTGTLDGFRWIRIKPSEDTVLPLPGRFVLNGGPPGAGSDDQPVEMVVLESTHDKADGFQAFSVTCLGHDYFTRNQAN